VKAEIEKHYSKNTPNYKVADYEDFRVLLEKEKSVDAVLCATPDHLHAYVSIAAMRLGKHVYCEKPLTHNVWEARQVARVAAETGVATQMGNQGHSSESIRQTVELIQGGAIGSVREVHA
jgi:predicted dehydrogenase